ncbi:MAG TPA: zf-HC2 domain-containing protein [Actinomycetota bacterium]|nr:zf-HC2 domain-containing protein [Actinomycetota bacterium]
MNCPAVREHLAELAVGVLPESERAAVERHLRWCAGCRKEASELGQAAATFALALAPAPVPSGLGDRVLARIKQVAGAPGSRRRLRAAAAAVVAAMVAVAGLGWGAVMAGRAERFADRAAQAERRREAALEQFRKVLVGLPLGTQLPEDDTHLGQLAPTAAGRVGGGAVLELVSPTRIDFVIVIVNGLPGGSDRLPYRIELRNSAGEVLRAGQITTLDADGGGQAFRQFQNRSLAGFWTVLVRDAAGRVVLRGAIDRSQAA